MISHFTAVWHTTAYYMHFQACLRHAWMVFLLIYALCRPTDEEEAGLESLTRELRTAAAMAASRHLLFLHFHQIDLWSTTAAAKQRTMLDLAGAIAKNVGSFFAKKPRPAELPPFAFLGLQFSPSLVIQSKPLKKSHALSKQCVQTKVRYYWFWAPLVLCVTSWIPKIIMSC